MQPSTTTAPGGFTSKMQALDGVTDAPAKDLKLGFAAATMFFVGFLGWAEFARVDAAINARGVVEVSGNRQEVKHKAGGVVQSLHIKEGDEVVAGQTLIDLAGDDTEANSDALMAEYIDLKAMEARLLAQADEQASFPEPVEFATLDQRFRPLVDAAMNVQQKTMKADLTYLATQRSVLEQRSQQYRQQITGAEEQTKANLRRRELIKDQLDSLKTLFDQGAVSKAKVRALEQDVAGLEGDYGQLVAGIAATGAQIEETRIQAVAAGKQFIDQVLSDINNTHQKLKTLEPQLTAARTAYDRLHIRAPASGRVLGLTAFTVGGVIAPGEKIMDIVPDNAKLVIRASVEARDGTSVRPGQLAQLTFSSLHERNAPKLTGHVEDVSADSLTDKATGAAFYTARVVLDEAAQVALAGQGVALKPGLPVDVVLSDRKRSMLTYLLEPFNQSLQTSFREP